MAEHYLIGIAAIIILGIIAQWLAWRLSLPSILILLVFGFVAGPVTGLLDPDELLGELLFPVVSISVAIILFEGGLSLQLSELRATGRVVANLVSIGALVTWMLSAGASFYILGFQLPIALLFGAILVVTGPTVIIPLLRHVRAIGRISSIVKWEGIVNDPIGAVLAVLVFEAILVGGVQETTATIILVLLKTLSIGIILGGFSAWTLALLLKRYWVPGYLQNSVTLMAVVAAFTVSNVLQAESGLFTVTLMGVILANQRMFNIKHIIEFKENLGILLLSGLFIILAARLELEGLATLGPRSLVFLAVLVLLVRPIAILVSTIRTNLNWSEKFFLSWMAPRGIVAAAVTAVFALELEEQAGFTEAELMIPEMFFIIVGTVAIYGLSAASLGRWLGVAQPNPQGVLFVGAHKWARAIAAKLQEKGYQVLLVDNNRSNINTARLEGLPTFYASVLSEYILDELELGSIGRLIALTPNDEVNSLATLHFAEVFDRSEVYQLAPRKADKKRKEKVSQPLRGRLVFDPELTYTELAQRFEDGSAIKTTKLTEQFDYDAYQSLYGNRAVSMFLIDATGDLSIFTEDNGISPQPGDSIFGLTEADTEAPAQVAATQTKKSNSK